MNPSYVVCQVCGRDFKTITANHLRAEGLTMGEYREAFPWSPTVSEESSCRRTQSRKKLWADPEWKKMNSSAIKKGKDNDEHRSAMAEKAHAQWARMTKEEKADRSRKLSTGALNQWSSMSYEERELRRQRFIKGTIERWADPVRNREIGDSIRQGRIRTGANIAQSLRMSEAIQSGKIHPQYRSVPTSYTKPDGTVIQMRSRAEARFASQLDEDGFTWDYEPDILQLSNGRSYIPDFYVHELEEYFEVKGFVGADVSKPREAGAVVVVP